MNYEEKYKAALERAKEMCVMPTDKATMEYIFPELAESADKGERIRRVIIEFLQAQNVLYDKINPEFTIKEAIAWLVKQGQTFTKKDVDDAYLKGVCDTKQELEKQGEQKSADNDEPKFKVGDWIVQKNIGVYKVIEICESWYEVVDNKNNHYSIGFDKEYMCHLWTIEDAKAGDILVSSINKNPFAYNGNYTSKNLGAYFGLTITGELLICDSHSNNWTDLTGTQPATKEQCNMLFKKLHDSDYKWDGEKKELWHKYL